MKLLGRLSSVVEFWATSKLQDPGSSPVDFYFKQYIIHYMYYYVYCSVSSFDLILFTGLLSPNKFFKVSEYLLQLAEESLQFIYKTFDQLYQQGPVAQRITRLTTDQKIGGSNPLGIDNILI